MRTRLVFAETVTYGMIPMVTLWHASYHCVTVPINVLCIILRHETNVYQDYKIRHTYTNCNICQYYTYGMTSIHVTCTICIMSLLMPWHNTTSVNTKTIYIPLLTLMPWYGTTISTIWNDTYLHIIIISMLWHDIMHTKYHIA